MTKVEEVARAIYEGRNGSGCVPWSRLPKAHQKPYMLDALNAVHEMRDPTKAMVDAAHDVPSDHAKDHWIAMIDAALSEKE